MIEALIGDMSGMLPDLTKEDAARILDYKNDETKIFAQLLVDFKNELTITDMKPEQNNPISELISQLSRAMPSLRRQHRFMLEHPKHEETKLFLAVKQQFENDIPDKWRIIVVKNLEYIAVGVETDARGTRKTFNEIMKALSTGYKHRDFPVIKNYLVGMKDKGQRLFALKLLMMIGYKVETSDEFREKTNEIVDRFYGFYNKR